MLLPVGMLLSEICGLVSVGSPLWREDGSVICSVITQWSESRRTRNCTLLSHLRLLQPGGPGSRMYMVSQYVLVSNTLVGLATRYYFLSECCGLVSVGCPLWRKDGSVICSVITQWSESRRTRNHTLLSHLRLPQPGGSGSRIYIPQEQGGPVIPPGTGFPLGYIYPSGIGWSSPKSSQKSKSRYDRRPVNQYVLVPSPLSIKGFHP
jgi:hypothetical protein